MWRAGAEAKSEWVPVPVRDDVAAGRWEDIALVATLIGVLLSNGYFTNGFTRFGISGLVFLALSFPIGWSLVYRLQENAAARAAARTHRFFQEGIEQHHLGRVDRLQWSDVVAADAYVRCRIDQHKRRGLDKVKRWKRIDLFLASGAAHRLQLGAYADNRAVGNAVWSLLPPGLSVHVIEV